MFGFERSLIVASVGKRNGRNGGGHYATVKAHIDRWQAFVRWFRLEDGPGCNDARQINRQTLLDYRERLSAWNVGEIAFQIPRAQAEPWQLSLLERQSKRGLKSCRF